MTATIVVVLVVVVLLAAVWLWFTANRLDRLHVRTEAAWAGLEGALARRVVATRAVAAAGGLTPERAAELRALATAADTAPRSGRADAENDLSRVLRTLPADLDPALAAELADAQERVVLARRFHNDAVRDTRALRAAWFTRVFGLAGRAALPDYFEIVEDARPDPVRRTAARVVLLDAHERVLLLSGVDPDVGVPWWITPGGGTEPGEELADTAVRELAEEVGVRLHSTDLVGPMWRRVARFEFVGVDYEQTEYYFAAQVAGSRAADQILDDSGDAPAAGPAGLDITGRTEQEQRTLTGHRWWTRAELAEWSEAVYPLELVERLPEVSALLRDRTAPPRPVEVQ
ncbi:NUDIX hydrolase [Nakamurella leprariae]|uniref:NUDIX domain-containing protein n=1 Tax=Nakamurella leprariae TaxID=2803911 RepID=A0A938YCE6_9ACTN|nr:NUDIX domain-containing protein [Nakamurella leprariae]MBM9467053.1 NUDIX domain-containing protein [Nakamurella leprariae]